MEIPPNIPRPEMWTPESIVQAVKEGFTFLIPFHFNLIEPNGYYIAGQQYICTGVTVGPEHTEIIRLTPEGWMEMLLWFPPGMVPDEAFIGEINENGVGQVWALVDPDDIDWETLNRGWQIKVPRMNPSGIINCGRCGRPGHTRRSPLCPLAEDAPRKKVFFYLTIPRHLARRFPKRSHPPHVTVLHVGDLTSYQWRKVLQAADEVLKTIEPFRVSMVEYDVFLAKDDYKYPHMTVESTALMALHHKLKEAIRDVEVTVKHYGYTPHATLAKIPQEDNYRGPKPTGSWIVNSVVLSGFEDYDYELEEQSAELVQKQAIIMRGVPGSGKTTYLEEHYPEAAVARADDFFTRGGVYRFDPKRAWLAHKICFDNYLTMLRAGLPLVAVDNTNITKSEVSRYYKAAVEHGYQPSIITILEDPEEAFQVGLHDVPREKVFEMQRKLERTKIPEVWYHQIIDFT